MRRRIPRRPLRRTNARQNGPGGLLAADETGVVTDHANAIARFGSDGTKRLTLKDDGGFPRRVEINDRYGIDLTAHSGARIAFEIDSIDRRTGDRIGSAPFTDLLGSMRKQRTVLRTTSRTIPVRNAPRLKSCPFLSAPSIPIDLINRNRSCNVALSR